jgi:hypothetical protein
MIELWVMCLNASDVVGASLEFAPLLPDDY